jgi:hypothetical protein
VALNVLTCALSGNYVNFGVFALYEDPVSPLVGWLGGWVVGWVGGWSVGWFGCLLAWLDGWLAGWLACLVACFLLGCVVCVVLACCR